MSISERLLKAWYRADGKDWLSIALLDVSWLYGGLVKLRRRLYASGVMNSTKPPVPVIVVGNVIAGGAGKTPVVIELAKLLSQHGYQVGIVSRGYGRRSQEIVEVRSDTPVSHAGDESVLIQRALGAPVFVTSDRADAARALLAAYPQTNVLVCDDGLQHLALQRDLEICVFDERGIGNGRLLPAGPLREAWPRDVDFILHRGAFETTSSHSYPIARQLADHALCADGARLSWPELAGKRLIALAGIAQPEAFFSMLRERGLALQETIALPDHYDFDSWWRTFQLSKTHDSCIICTEKDAVKLWPTPLAQTHQIVAVPLQTQLSESFTAALLEKLSSLQAKK